MISFVKIFENFAKFLIKITKNKLMIKSLFKYWRIFYFQDILFFK